MNEASQIATRILEGEDPKRVFKQMRQVKCELCGMILSGDD
jgi:ribosomal protein S28E/S33